jgi:hypothetical protein
MRRVCTLYGRDEAQWAGVDGRTRKAVTAMPRPMASVDAICVRVVLVGVDGVGGESMGWKSSKRRVCGGDRRVGSTFAKIFFSREYFLRWAIHYRTSYLCENQHSQKRGRILPSLRHEYVASMP